MNFSNVKDWTIYEGSVIRVTDSLNRVIWEKNLQPSEPPLDPDRATQYFYVEDVTGSNNTLSIKKEHANAPTITVYKSTDQTNWTSMGTTSTTPITATIPANGKLYLKATTDAWRYSTYYDWNNINFSGYANIGGNIMSLLYGDNFQNQTTLTEPYTFAELFINNTNLYWITNLVMPATTLTNYCYIGMFTGCTNLRHGQNSDFGVHLPARTLTRSCYEGMFQGCINMEKPRVMPDNVTMAYASCDGMYYGCTSLQHGGSFNSYTLADYSMAHMFQGCTSLSTPSIPFDSTLAPNCFQGMFKGCTGITSVMITRNRVLEEGCYLGMFEDCTSITRVYNFSEVTTLAKKCYSNMFKGCTSLTTVPSDLLSITTLAESCYNGMFEGCTSLVTPPTLPATTLTRSCYDHLFYGCTSLNTIKIYADNITPSDMSLSNWVYNVSPTGDFYNLGSATYSSGYGGIPSGWTVHTSL